MSCFRHFLHDINGATSIEYALIAAGVSIVILAALTQIGSSIQQKFYVQVANGLN